MIILGIDPGTATTGYGIVKRARKRGRKRDYLECLKYGLIKTSPSLPTCERLNKINKDLNGLIKEYQPTVLAVENVYFFKNLKTAMPVSQAKGVILLTAAKKKIPVYEFTPLEVKKNIVNYGWAKKQKIQKKVKSLLGLDLDGTHFPDDAADALAVAICCIRFLTKNGF